MVNILLLFIWHGHGRHEYINHISTKLLPKETHQVSLKRLPAAAPTEREKAYFFLSLWHIASYLMAISIRVDLSKLIEQ